MRKIVPILLMSVFAGMSCTHKPVTPPSLNAFNDAIHHWNLEHKERNYARYEPTQYREIADNFIAYQNEDGGWPKNLDWLAVLNTDSVYAALKESYKKSTLDNRNTFPQIEYLADVYRITKEPRYKDAVLKGMGYLLDTQKSNGGWRGWDVDAITFNDDVTTGALELFRNILQGDESFSWLDAATLQRIKAGYEKGLQMVLDCQVVQDGVKTAWAQQHDNETLVPVKARTYELPGITANESCEVISFLMGIENPSPEVVESVKSAVAWLEKVQIKGLRVERVTLPEDQIINHEYPYDNVVVEDPDAEPIWARYYEVSDNTPFMCTRAGEKVWKLADVNAERRTGYAWYGYWPKKVLKIYPDWLERVSR
ncbi:pectate lyase [Bacteroides sp. 51]|uniref:pectate lyase n=1 Tax=Bacteroides sp. 51 TaxID=2302938 RepID=UPI001EF1C9A2|nr:pectate lyase [Bacteroides sp. 51]